MKNGSHAPSYSRHAQELLSRGMCVVPATKEKFPALNSWRDFQDTLPVADEVDNWFSLNPHGIGFVCGRISGGLEVLDLDAKHDPAGTLNQRAENAIKSFIPGLWERLVIESTPSGGLHLYFRSPCPEGNLKLAFCLNAQNKRMAIAETRGEGGFIVAAPTPGYSLIQGSLSHPPEITDDERSALFAAARSLDTLPKPPPEKPAQLLRPNHLPGTSPGDAYNSKDDFFSVLKSHGWTTRGEKHWTRPGKDHGTSATWDTLSDCPRHFYVFSPNAHPFEDGKTYSPFAVFTMLECGGDYSRGAKELLERGYGERTVRPKMLELDWDDEPAKTPAPTPAPLKSRGLFDFTLPKPGDPSILLGKRYLSRGDGMILVSTSSMGKSSLSIQAATSWSLGRPLFGGLDPHGPQRSLIFQSEDSDGDVAEVGISLAHAMKLTPDEITQVNANVRIITDRVHRGTAFLAELKTQIEEHQPDFVFINPLLAFLDGDVNDAESVGRFLREGLNSLNEPPRFGYVVIHHTAKPPKEDKDRKWSEVMYDMAGSADITNWARAIVSLRADENEGEFKLVLAKRGRRAGFTNKRDSRLVPGMKIDEPTNTISLRHSKERLPIAGHPEDLHVIHWERYDPENEVGRPQVGRKIKWELDPFRPFIPKADQRAQSLSQLWKKAEEINGIPKNSFRDLLNREVECGMIERFTTESGGTYRFMAAPKAR